MGLVADMGARPLKKQKTATEGEACTSLSADDFRSQHDISSGNDLTLPDPIQTLAQAPFGKKIQKRLLGAGFTDPTPIQAQGWPVMMSGKNLVAVAKTGSGKTLGFLLPIMRSLTKNPATDATGPVALVLAPTRELAVQIETAAQTFGAGLGVNFLCVYGGVPKPPQAQALKKDCPQLLVATPGRLLDHMEDRVLSLKDVRHLILDEADRMLDMGFEPQMLKILKDIPESRQTVLFTATWPKSVQKLAGKYLGESAVHINVGETEDLSANKAVTQQFFELDDSEKDGKLWELLQEFKETDKIIIFANTKRRIEYLSKMVWSCEWNNVAMSGDKSQADRDKGLAQFVAGQAPIMIATDVCSRGLDIKGVTHVINFDMARDVESYVHRIGRTGRAGATGTSITFFNAAYDIDCAPALLKIAQEAGQPIPAFLEKACAKAGKGKNKGWRY